MRFFSKRHDGGAESGVTGYWLVEIKWLFSIVLLKFEPNHRENYHSHAFNAITLWLKGEVVEESIGNEHSLVGYGRQIIKAGNVTYTPKSNTHKIHCTKPAWAISFRGAWDKTWKEYNPTTHQWITLTNGRKLV